MSFSILNPDSPEWDVLFDQLSIDQQDIFYSSSFARVCQNTINRNDEVACAAMVSDAGGVLLYPFAKRSIDRLANVPAAVGLCDLTSLYGRGGIVCSSVSSSDLAQFHAELASYCDANAIICGFDRYHPVIENHTRAASTSKVMDVGGFVVVDLRPGLEEVETAFKSSVRKDLRKAERNGISCFWEANCDHLKDFFDIYHHTMGRNSASEFYFFNEEYFTSIAKEMPGNFYFFYAMSGGDIVSCELVLFHGKYCHSFLGGTKREALSLCANPLLKREIIKFFKGQGCEYFLLGGGTKPDDGIFNFKKAYAPDGVRQSLIGGMLWNSRAYEQLKIDMLSSGGSVQGNRFQFYDLN